ncbi:MAG: hypothetical protein N2690_13265, partial [Rhodocyclaceae bacterium]|nr:hypothetical protein [Rhodocyclaceae bacterium]
VLPERTIRQQERFFIDENMFLMLPKGCAVLTVPGELARFVFTSPVPLQKDAAALRVSTSGAQTDTESDQAPQKSTGGALTVTNESFV